MEELKAISTKIRKDIIEMIYNAGSGHPGSSLSCVEVIVSLYNNVIDEKDDKFILSKGHAVPTLYAVLANKGYIKKEELFMLRKANSNLQGHPTNKTNGIDVCTGSLGQGLSIANGIAIAKKIDNRPGYVYCLIGDGELEEGQIWEAVMTANKYSLDNLITFVDNNNLQIDGSIYEVKKIDDIGKKFEAFGFRAYITDGHNEDEIITTINKAKKTKGKPIVIILKTIKGKGISFMENDVSWHGKTIDDQEYKKAKEELEESL